ncbi:hypothetical protein DFA_02113 [Cavenderia fasciculata]|uniref:Uncharacterized protein n=1 Tax=Cavenderia fasciculata TaxID=261658 RepID=F4PYR0_CACFS|nr:uncharacterized protein DFA_02113 [Cavenderia fasciculata]EGG19326.1 hypothetical protein DFA_02113 [Cavenderia fasciculata]|eukprot:XP_004357597.1 hypothetical protein DFA_02113 [Cavenderia fasciculata]
MQHPGDKEVTTTNLSTNEFGKVLQKLIIIKYYRKRPNETCSVGDAGKQSELKKMKSEVPVLSEGQQFINEAAKQMMEGGQHVLEQTKEALASAADSTKGAFTSTVAAVSSAAQPVIEKAKEISTTIGDNVNATLLKSAEFRDDLKKKADSMMEQVEKRVEEASKALKDKPAEDPVKCSLPKDTLYVDEPLIKDKPEEKLLKDQPASEESNEEKKDATEDGTKKAPAKGRGRGRPKKSNIPNLEGIVFIIKYSIK